MELTDDQNRERIRLNQVGSRSVVGVSSKEVPIGTGLRFEFSQVFDFQLLLSSLENLAEENTNLC